MIKWGEKRWGRGISLTYAIKSLKYHQTTQLAKLPVQQQGREGLTKVGSSWLNLKEGNVLKVCFIFAKTVSRPRFIHKPSSKNTREVRLVQARHMLGRFYVSPTADISQFLPKYSLREQQDQDKHILYRSWVPASNFVLARGVSWAWCGLSSQWHLLDLSSQVLCNLSWDPCELLSSILSRQRMPWVYYSLICKTI